MLLVFGYLLAPGLHLWWPVGEGCFPMPLENQLMSWQQNSIQFFLLSGYGGFHSHGGAPIAGWFMENPNLLKGWELGVLPILGHHHIYILYIYTYIHTYIYTYQDPIFTMRIWKNDRLPHGGRGADRCGGRWLLGSSDLAARVWTRRDHHDRRWHARGTRPHSRGGSLGNLWGLRPAEDLWRPGVIHIMVDGMAGWITVRSDLYADEG